MCNLRFGLEGLGRVSWGGCAQVQVHLCEHPGYGVAHYGISYTYKVIKKGISQYYCPIFFPSINFGRKAKHRSVQSGVYPSPW